MVHVPSSNNLAWFDTFKVIYGNNFIEKKYVKPFR